MLYVYFLVTLCRLWFECSASANLICLEDRLPVSFQFCLSLLKRFLWALYPMDVPEIEAFCSRGTCARHFTIIRCQTLNSLISHRLFGRSCTGFAREASTRWCRPASVKRVWTSGRWTSSSASTHRRTPSAWCKGWDARGGSGRDASWSFWLRGARRGWVVLCALSSANNVSIKSANNVLYHWRPHQTFQTPSSGFVQTASQNPICSPSWLKPDGSFVVWTNYHKFNLFIYFFKQIKTTIDVWFQKSFGQMYLNVSRHRSILSWIPFRQDRKSVV